MTETVFENSTKQPLFFKFIPPILPLALLLYYKMLNLFPFPIQAGDSPAAEGSSVNQAILGLVFALAGLVIIRNWSYVRTIFKSNLLLVILLLYTLLSCFWSPSLNVSFKRWIQFLGIILVAVSALAAGQNAGRIVKTFLFFSTVSVLLSLILVVVMPSPETISPIGWTGIFQTKNELGQVCATCVLLWITVPKTIWKGSRLIRYGIIAIGLVVVLFSKSATSIVLVFSFTFLYFITKVPISFPIKLFLLPIPVFLFLFYLLNLTSSSVPGFFLNVIGKDATFTGRTELWSAILRSFSEHPVLGLGYNAFWVGLMGPSSKFVGHLSWNMNQGHNGYIDILNELGIVGALIFLLVLVQAVTRSLRLTATNKENFIYALMVYYPILTNIMESSFCRQSHLTWLTFLVFVVVIGYKTNLSKKKENREILAREPKESSDYLQVPTSV